MSRRFKDKDLLDKGLTWVDQSEAVRQPSKPLKTIDRDRLNKWLEIAKESAREIRDSIAVRTPNVEQAFSHEPLAKKEGSRLNPPCRIHVHSKRKRLCDSDGVSAKAAIDGIVLAGILQDDSAEFVQEVTYSQEKWPIDETVITIEEIG